MKWPQYDGRKSLPDLNLVYALCQQSGDISVSSGKYIMINKTILSGFYMVMP